MLRPRYPSMNESLSRPGVWLLSLGLACGYALLSACSSADDELTRFIDDTTKEPGGRVYAASDMRSPFLPSSPGSGAGPNGVRPDSKRNREFLEQYSLDTLKMVGTLRLGGQIYGLVETKDGLVHRVIVGNHLGQAEGKVTDITPSKITLVEIVPDSLGGYMERPAALALNE
jgi:type IV pilus assembly protein PilP